MRWVVEGLLILLSLLHRILRKILEKHDKVREKRVTKEVLVVR